MDASLHTHTHTHKHTQTHTHTHTHTRTIYIFWILCRLGSNGKGWKFKVTANLNRGLRETSVAISSIKDITLQIDTKHTGKKKNPRC